MEEEKLSKFQLIQERLFGFIDTNEPDKFFHEIKRSLSTNSTQRKDITLAKNRLTWITDGHRKGEFTFHDYDRVRSQVNEALWNITSALSEEDIKNEHL